MMKMRFFLATIVTIVSICLTGCSKPSAEQQAMNTVLQSYEALLAGDYATFLNGRAYMDSIPESFREQLLVGCKQFIRQQQEAHEGIVGFEASRCQMDTLQNLMQVFLLVHFADSTTEEITVPMVEYQGEWKMK